MQPYRRTCLLIILLSLCLILPVFAEETSSEEAVLSETDAYCYDYDAAVTYASKHCYELNGNCAEFVSACLRTGGLSVDPEVDGCTSLHAWLMTLPSIREYHMDFAGSTNIRPGILQTLLKPGDVVLYYCDTCASKEVAPYLHAVLYQSTDDRGYLCGWSHNPQRSGYAPYRYYNNCYDCYKPISDLYFYHFPFSICFDDSGYSDFYTLAFSKTQAFTTDFSSLLTRILMYQRESIELPKKHR